MVEEVRGGRMEIGVGDAIATEVEATNARASLGRQSCAPMLELQLGVRADRGLGSPFP